MVAHNLRGLAWKNIRETASTLPGDVHVQADELKRWLALSHADCKEEASAAKKAAAKAIAAEPLPTVKPADYEEWLQGYPQ